MVILAANMQEYFREALTLAMRRSKSALSEELQAYLVYLLTDFARSEKVYAGVNTGEQPILVLLLERALESPQPEANRIFKQIGDSTLYLSGFFGEKAQATGVSNSYYFAMGGDAYLRLAQNTRLPIYHELSETFTRLVFLLRQVSLAHKTGTSEEILSWIEQYKTSKNPELQVLLAQNGVLLKDEDPTC
ncbi:MAG: hypothetical protein WCK42_03535 [Myxococcaceae bacterium]